MEFANMSGLDALDEIFDTADARAVGAASEEPVADVDMADVVTAHGDFECALRDRPEEDPALWRLVDGDGQLWRCGSRCRHKNCMQRLAAFHYDWLCTTARKAERLRAATKARDLVNMDRKHGGGQAKGAKVHANGEQVARAQDGQITPGCFEIQDTRAWCTHCGRRPYSRAPRSRTVTHVHVSACALHADRVHEGKAAKSSCVLTILRSQHARFAAAR